MRPRPNPFTGTSWQISQPRIDCLRYVPLLFSHQDLISDSMQRHREQTAHLQAALLHSGLGAGPDTNRSAGLHSFAAIATDGAARVRRASLLPV